MPSGRHCRSPLYRNGSKFRNSVPLWSVIFHRILSACLLDGIVVRPFAATAAKPVIRCRCGKPAPASFCLRSFPRWKVPVEMAFCHHLLIFVISGSASEVALGGPASVCCGEGAGQIAVSPSPSRIRYKWTCPRGLSRSPMQDSRSEGAGRNRLSPPPSRCGSVSAGLCVGFAGIGGGEFCGWTAGRGGHGGVAGNEFGGCGGEPAVLVECFA